MLDTPLSNFAPIGGVYLLGLIALVTTGLLISIIRNVTRRNAVAGVIVAGIWVAGWQMNELTWTRATGDQLRVAIVQNDVPLIEKWDESETLRIIKGYMAKSMTQDAVDLIVWPEAAVPDYLDTLSNEFWNDIRSHPADF